MQIFCWELHGDDEESEKTLYIKLNHYGFSNLSHLHNWYNIAIYGKT
jgi:hypothetical protein